MKIAILSEGIEFGGATAFCVNLAVGLKEMGASCEVFSLSLNNPFADDFKTGGIPVHVVDERSLIFEDRLSEAFRKISEYGPEAVIANLGVLSYELLRYMPEGVVRIGMIHDEVMQPRLLIPRYRDVLDGVVTVNCHLLPQVRDAAAEVNSIYLAHGIPLPKIAPRSANFELPLKMIYFGRLIEGKGTRFFPLVIEELHRRQIPFRWTIQGAGPEEEYLRKQLEAEINSGNVKISLPVSRNDLMAIVRDHDVFIMASDLEGGPLTLLEAMALGLVPICNDIPCMAQEVVKPENGFSVPREAARYAEIVKLLHEDRAKLERMSAAARETISFSYSTKAMAERYLKFIKSISRPWAGITWPKEIKPFPMRDDSSVTGFAKNLGLARQARRWLKRLGS